VWQAELYALAAVSGQWTVKGARGTGHGKYKKERSNHENTKLARHLSGGPPEAGKACPPLFWRGTKTRKKKGSVVS
jgi:hypothetical protein